MPRLHFRLALVALALISLCSGKLSAQTPPLVVPNTTPPTGNGIGMQPTPAAAPDSSPVPVPATSGTPPTANPTVMPNPYGPPAAPPRAGGSTIFPGPQFSPFRSGNPFLGGNPYGGPIPANAETGRGGWTQSENILIVVSRSGRRVHGYSALTGDLNSVSVEGTNPGELRPLVSNELACFISGNKAYGFSARTGGWSEIDLNGEGMLSYQGKFVAVTVGSKTYLYSAAGNWKVIDTNAD